MVSKRGQLTIFIIIGILILVVLGSGIYIYSLKSVPEQEGIAIDIEGTKIAVKEYAQKCITDGLREGVYKVGMQGGYYAVPPVSEDYFGANIPYYFYEGKVLFPPLSEFEEQLNILIKVELKSCLDELKNFYELDGVLIEYKINLVNSKISEKTITTNVYAPIKIGQMSAQGDGFEITNQEILTAQNTLAELTNFLVVSPIEYKKMWEWSKNIVELQTENPASFPLGDISDFAFEEGFTFEILEVITAYGEPEGGEGKGEEWKPDDYNKVLISLVDQNLFEDPYYFTFAIKYDNNYEEVFAEDIALEKKLNELDLSTE
ncbi:hypothetical protein HOC13_00025 [Candidatus Woesearchaeota archaeon]|jgi:hypothetical protein|nr:hypothetical protein [Candidatus Woesearchaeota archaeon]